MSDLLELQKHFVNLRFGTIIHFNSGTIQFHDSPIVDWEFDHENAGEPRRYPFDEKDWNPSHMDCQQWASVAKSAGCRFAVFVAKHHEGFATWPTAYSEHCVRNATNKTDVVAAYLHAFRNAGLEAGLYFSILDLTAGINRSSCTEEQKRIIKGQLTELLTNYGEIPFLVVDGWNAPWGGPSYDALPFEELDRHIKSIQPNCLVMNIGWTKDVQGSDVPFFEGGAGQDVQGIFAGPGILCQKLTRTWMWRETDTPPLTHDADWALERMNRYFPRNVNFILNLSPNKEGEIDEYLAAEYAKIGEKFRMPAPLQELPEGWLKRRK